MITISDPVFISHISASGKRQSVSDHLKNTADKASMCLKCVGLEKTAYLSGMIHDMGKYASQFQRYIRAQDKTERGSVIHSFQGCRFVLESFHSSEDPYAKLTAEIISYAIGAHHGLFDCFGKTNDSGFSHRKEKEKIGYETSVSAFLNDMADIIDIDSMFSAAQNEVQIIVGLLGARFEPNDEFAFSLGLLERLVLSALIEGDRQDTAEFMNGVIFPQWPEDMRPIWQAALQSVESRLSGFPVDSPLTKARRCISDACSCASKLPTGIYRLNVPTGGGKTLSSLRYALAHAKNWNKKRIVFTSPLLSILEQNAAVIRDFVGDDSLILEHHSNVVQEGLSQEKLDERELYVQTWNAPIIITTLVQLLNTLFDGSSSSIRRFHSLCDSIIVIDEVQTVPTKMMTLFNLSVQFLSEICHATVILCSATQPYFEKTDHPIKTEIKDLVPFDEALWNVFKRTEILSLPAVRSEEINTVITQQMKSVDSLLVICNKKAEAESLAHSFASCDYAVFHLSAGMCIQHRRDTVNALKESLNRGGKTLCFSTQVIEAGVDISFQRVIRFSAGMDSVIQAAGRCNRNGEYEQCQPVYLINISDETLGSLPEIMAGKTATIALQNAFFQNPDQFNNDMASEESIRFFYEKLYGDMAREYQDYPLQHLKTTIYELLSDNPKYRDTDAKDCDEYILSQAFRTAGQEFDVFQTRTIEVIVPYGDMGRNLISSLCSAQAEEDPVYRSMLLKTAGAYSVSVYDGQMQRLLKKQAVYPVCKNYAFALDKQYYDDTIGLTYSNSALDFLEV